MVCLSYITLIKSLCPTNCLSPPRGVSFFITAVVFSLFTISIFISCTKTTLPEVVEGPTYQLALNGYEEGRIKFKHGGCYPRPCPCIEPLGICIEIPIGTADDPPLSESQIADGYGTADLRVEEVGTELKSHMYLTGLPLFQMELFQLTLIMTLALPWQQSLAIIL